MAYECVERIGHQRTNRCEEIFSRDLLHFGAHSNLEHKTLALRCALRRSSSLVDCIPFPPVHCSLTDDQKGEKCNIRYLRMYPYNNTHKRMNRNKHWIYFLGKKKTRHGSSGVFPPVEQGTNPSTKMKRDSQIYHYSVPGLPPPSPFSRRNTCIGCSARNPRVLREGFQPNCAEKSLRTVSCTSEAPKKEHCCHVQLQTPDFVFVW